MEFTFAFEKLNAYIEARKLVKMVYIHLRKYPAEERYSICDQMRRSVVSVTSNIAEGTSRTSDKERIHFIEISYGSLMELLSQVQVSLDLEYIDKEIYTQLHYQICIVAQLLSGLRTSYQKRLS